MFLPQTPTCYSSQRDKKENTAILTDGKPQKSASLAFEVCGVVIHTAHGWFETGSCSG